MRNYEISNRSTLTFSGIWLAIIAFIKGEWTLYNFQGPFIIFWLFAYIFGTQQINQKQSKMIKEQIRFLDTDFGKSIILIILSAYYQRFYKELQFSYMYMNIPLNRISQFYNYLFLFYSLCFFISYIGKLCVPKEFQKSTEDVKLEI